MRDRMNSLDSRLRGNDEGTCGNDTSSLPLPGHPPRAGAGLKPRPYVVSPFAVRRGRGLVSFRACWMVWRTPSMLLMTSLFQKRRAR